MEKEHRESIEQTKRDLLKNYEKHLDEIFAKDNFELSFDERERLIYEKMKKETNAVMENHIRKDPKGIEHLPDETCLCSCGTEATLCRDQDGNPQIFERELKTQSGPVKIKEYGYYCSKERRNFFSSKST